MSEPMLIESPHGTVCSACRLWPDLCTCRPDHPARQILKTAFVWSPEVQDLLKEKSNG